MRLQREGQARQRTPRTISRERLHSGRRPPAEPAAADAKGKGKGAAGAPAAAVSEGKGKGKPAEEDGIWQDREIRFDLQPALLQLPIPNWKYAAGARSTRSAAAPLRLAVSYLPYAV